MALNCYITFPTTYFAIRAENLLKGSSYKFKMVPVPRSISSSCGTALRCECPDMAIIEDFLLNKNLELEGLYSVQERGLQAPVVTEMPLASSSQVNND